jgi:predicted nucleic acid-binding protein
MTRFGIDAPAAVRLARERLVVPAKHQLVAPNLLRSQALAMIYGEYRRGDIDRDESRVLLDGITTMKVRLLGDRVSRGRAFTIAEQLGLDDTARAEYIAVAQLQADALVSLDPELARLGAGLVRIATFDELFA